MSATVRLERDGDVAVIVIDKSVHTTGDLHRIDCPTLMAEQAIGRVAGNAPAPAQLDIGLNCHAAHMTCIEQPKRLNLALRMFLDSAVGASLEAHPGAVSHPIGMDPADHGRPRRT